MTMLNVSGHRLARRPAPPEARPQYILATADGRYLHESGTQLTGHRAYAWQGHRDQMRAMLEALPEGLRNQLRGIAQSRPRPAGRA